VTVVLKLAAISLQTGAVCVAYSICWYRYKGYLGALCMFDLCLLTSVKSLGATVHHMECPEAAPECPALQKCSDRLWYNVYYACMLRGI
jgi:hypothetical protein